MVKKILAKSYLCLILALLYLPILLIIVYSFSNSSNYSFANGFSFGAYEAILTSPQTPKLMKALENTFFIAGVSSVIATVLGTVAAIGIFSMKRKFRTVIENINQMPIINSEIVMAVSLMLFFVTFRFPAGYIRLIIGHISFCTPYVVLSVMPRLMQMDSNIYEAALDLGANSVKAMTKVLIPILVPGIVSGFVMSFTLSMDDFIITQINKGAGIETLSTYIYEDARLKGMEPFWFAVFSIIFVVILGIMLFINLYNSRKKEAKKEI
jgi:spermidine/putrescine transport system permease protein